MKFIPLSTLLFLVSATLFSQSNIQQPVSVNADGAAPAASAMLDVSATDKGMLVPRMTTAQRTAIASPAAGLLVFDTTTGGFWFYNGTAWVEVARSYTAGTGINITGTTIQNTGDTNPSDDLLMGQSAGGDLTGTYPNPTVTANAIGSAEISDGSVAAVDLNSMGASNGQVLQWNGSAWVPGSVAGGGIPNKIQDADSDTKIQVEESPDEDAIRFDVGGTEQMVLRKNANGAFRLELPDLTGNSFIGWEAGKNNNPAYLVSGYENTFLGYQAGFSNTVGYQNTATGNQSLLFNTDGIRNTANGWGALLYNTLGADNTAVGWGALYNNLIGDGNTASGGFAMYSNTTGFDNTAVGQSALYYNTTGKYNSAFGTQALVNNVSGENNTAIGYGAAYAGTNNQECTAIGANAGVGTFMNSYTNARANASKYC